jgi:hypothetical protein
MAVALESEIMAEIGLGNSYHWSNGSESCEYIRNKAAKALPDILQRYHDEGKEIATPDRELCTLLSDVAQRGDQRRDTLTNTWCAASYVIQAHCYLYHAKDEQEKRNIIDDITIEIRKSYLSPISVSRERENKRMEQFDV